MTDSTIIKTIFIKADPQTVWQFLTDKNKLGEWFHPAQADLQEGEDYVLLVQDKGGVNKPIIWGTVLEVKPAEKLVYTFAIEPFGKQTTTVTWQLQAEHGGTSLMLSHEGVDVAMGKMALQMLMSLDVGWDEHFERLRKVVA